MLLTVSKNLFGIKLYYLRFNGFVFILKKKNYLFFNKTNNIKILQSKILVSKHYWFYQNLQNLFKYSNYKVKTILEFRSLYYFFLKIKNNYLYFSFGGSHQVKLNLKKFLLDKVTLIQQRRIYRYHGIEIQSSNILEMLRLCFLIKKYRLPNKYTGKGFFFKGETIKIKKKRITN